VRSIHQHEKRIVGTTVRTAANGRSPASIGIEPNGFNGDVAPDVKDIVRTPLRGDLLRPAAFDAHTMSGW
jgi:hypothetical protein